MKNALGFGPAGSGMMALNGECFEECDNVCAVESCDGPRMGRLGACGGESGRR